MSSVAWRHEIITEKIIRPGGVELTTVFERRSGPGGVEATPPAVRISIDHRENTEGSHVLAVDKEVLRAIILHLQCVKAEVWPTTEARPVPRSLYEVLSDPEGTLRTKEGAVELDEAMIKLSAILGKFGYMVEKRATGRTE